PRDGPDLVRDFQSRDDPRDLSAAPTRRTRGDAGEPHLAHTVWCVEGGIPAVLARNQLHWLLPRRDERRAVVPVQSAARVRGDERRRARTVVASCASAQRRAAERSA